MSKAFLAIKAVKRDGTSLFAAHPKFKTKYEIGKRVRCVHRHFPFWLAAANNIGIGSEGDKLYGLGAPYDKILLVRVLAKDATHDCHWSNDIGYKQMTFKDIVDGSSLDTQLAARSLLPLEFIPHGADIRKFLKDAAKRYKLPLFLK